METCMSILFWSLFAFQQHYFFKDNKTTEKVQKVNY